MKEFFAIGKGDNFAIPVMTPVSNPLASLTTYTKPSLEPFYSHYGFAYPLTADTLPLEVVVDDTVPVTSKFLNAHNPVKRYLLVDHKARMWRILIQPDNDGESVISHALVHQNCGWWSMDGSEEPTTSEDRDLLTGFLYTDPSQTEINAFFKKQYGFTKLVWMSVSVIAKTLNEKFSEVPKNRRMSEDERVTRRSIIRLVDDALMKASLRTSGESHDEDAVGPE